MSYFFTVLTYPGGITEEIQQALCRFADNKFSKYIIVKEFGKSQTNPHLNIVYQLPEHLDERNWSKNSNKYFKQNCYFQLPEKTFNLVQTKKCSSPENVVGGYLQKEHNAQIIINKGFDIESMKHIADENRKKVKITLNNAHEIVHDFCQINNIYPNTKIYFREILTLMVHQGYKIHVVLPYLNKIYDNYHLYYGFTAKIVDKYLTSGMDDLSLV